LLSIVAVAFLALIVSGCWGAAHEPVPSETASPPQGLGVSTVAVTNVVGLAEGAAAKVLAAAGLVTNVRYVDDVPRVGAVFRAVPAGGSDVPEGSVVVLFISLPPRLPLPGQEHEMEMGKLAGLVARHPEVFVGLYRDEAAVPHVVFGPGADPADWADRLAQAAKGISYPAAGIGCRIDTCSHSLASLRAIQEEITTRQDWTSNEHLAFGVGVDAKTCTVRVQSDLLTRADIEALVDRYHTAVSFDTSEGSHPVRLSPAEDEGGTLLEYLQT